MAKYVRLPDLDELARLASKPEVRALIEEAMEDILLEEKAEREEEAKPEAPRPPADEEKSEDQDDGDG